MRAMYTASSGMMAQELNVQVISNNIANMRTTGYKKQRAAFQDLMYDHVRRVGAQASDQDRPLSTGRPEGSLGLPASRSACSSRSAARAITAKLSPERLAISSKLVCPSLWLRTQSSARSSSGVATAPPADL